MAEKSKAMISYLSDNETKVDLLSNESIAATIITLLLQRPDQPVTVGVHGDWGAGKSSMLEMIEAGLAKQDKVLCLKFNGWRFQGFEDAKIALLEGIVTGLLEKRPMLTKTADKVKAVFKRIDWLKVAKSAGSLALTSFTGIPTLGQIQTVISTLDTMFRDPSQRPAKEKVDAAFEDAYSLLKPSDQSRNIPEEIGEFRKAFDELLNEAKVERLVVLIDDLDRCLPETAIETLEAVRLFVFTSHTAFVVAADEAMIEYAVRKHFPDLPNTTGPLSYARNYLEKLIQVPFRIPPLGVSETRIYVTLLLIGVELGEEDADFINLISSARERMKRPWAGETLDFATVKSILKEKSDRVNHALNLSDQIGPILAGGTQGNPRQIKRFLNTLMLRKSTAEARGFGADILLPALAKLMLAERFIPSFFDQIAKLAVSSPNGICEDLKRLEVSVSDKASKISRAGEESDKGIAAEKEKEVVTVYLSEWLSSQYIKSWAAISPSLADMDLRPYLFVTKDRKDYFGATTVLGHLAVIAEKLFGPKIVVQAHEQELTQLASPEAAQVFELLRSRIMSGASFELEPDGIAGLTVLVKAHSSLQSNLLDFLDTLPDERLGAWVVRGWGEVIRNEESEKRFNQLLQKWSKSKNSMLKTAATAALSMQR